MDRELRQKRKVLVSRLAFEDTAVSSGRRLASVLFLLWAITRILQVAAELLCAVQGILLIYSWHNTLMLIVIPLFLSALYMGYRWTVIFLVFMGIMLMWETFSMDLYSILNPVYMLDARLYAFTMIVAAYGQLVFPIILMINRNAKLYFDSVKEISRQMEGCLPGLNRRIKHEAKTNEKQCESAT